MLVHSGPTLAQVLPQARLSVSSLYHLNKKGLLGMEPLEKTVINWSLHQLFCVVL